MSVVKVIILIILTVVFICYLQSLPLKFERGYFVSTISITTVYPRIRYEYRCEGRRYLAFLSRDKTTRVEGDTYEVLIDSTDCDRIEILYEKPCFLPLEKKIPSVGIIDAIGGAWDFLSPQVSFKYKVNGKEYVRTQRIPKVYEVKFGKIKKGQKFEIYYWDENPQRSIIYLDKPIEE